MDYIDLPKVKSVPVSDLQNPKSKRILDAISMNPDVEFINAQLGIEETEYLIIEVKNGRISSENVKGIEFRERLAIGIEPGSKNVPRVLPLRECFPELMHTNEAKPGFPRDLCLYNEAPTSVFRTWTPEKFLRRIFWWLENAAEETLHLADQPLEQPFFSSHHNVILPWNTDDHIAQEKLKDLCISNIVERPSSRGNGEDFTFITNFKDCPERWHYGNPVNIDVIPHIITLPPQVHGTINRLPVSLAGFYDFLDNQSPTECEQLKVFLISRGLKEESANTRAAFTLFLIFTPNKRDEHSDEVESTYFNALLKLESPGHIAKSFGLCTNSLSGTSSQRFQPVIGANFDLSSKEVLKEDLLHVEVVTKNSHETNRSQSGVQDDGPNGAVVGVGALGSTLIELWSRSGWGKWKIIDHDYIRPHNLVRHTALLTHIGRPKVDVVAELASLVSAEPPRLESSICNVVTTTESELQLIYDDIDFVIDASTTLDYPRRVSLFDDAPRHCSVFLTPSGEASVLLCEDAGRTLRMISIEAQYYRALVNDPWGGNLLSQSNPAYYSGASCRDISTELAYSSVMTHSANIAEQIQKISTQPQPLARIWERSKENGAVSVHDIELNVAFTVKAGNLTISYDQGLINKMQLLRTKNLPSESGGILVGYHDFNINHIVIVDARPAPEDSDSSTSSFQRGLKNVTQDLDFIRVTTNSHVDYIGEWHSHPKGCSSSPSSLDIEQLEGLSNMLAEDGLPAISMIVSKHPDNTDDIRLMVAKHG